MTIHPSGSKVPFPAVALVILAVGSTGPGALADIVIAGGNDSFESDLANWTTWGANAEIQMHPLAPYPIKDGAKVLMIKDISPSGGVYAGITGLTNGESYTAYSWARAVQAGSSAQFQMGVDAESTATTWGAGVEFQGTAITASQTAGYPWSGMTVTFTADGDGAVRLFLRVNALSGYHGFQLDDIYLGSDPAQPPPPEGCKEPGDLIDDKSFECDPIGLSDPTYWTLWGGVAKAEIQGAGLFIPHDGAKHVVLADFNLASPVGGLYQDATPEVSGTHEFTFYVAISQTSSTFRFRIGIDDDLPLASSWGDGSDIDHQSSQVELTSGGSPTGWSQLSLSVNGLPVGSPVRLFLRTERVSGSYFGANWDGGEFQDVENWSLYAP